jgi:hypothetical protein
MFFEKFIVTQLVKKHFGCMELLPFSQNPPSVSNLIEMNPIANLTTYFAKIQLQYYLPSTPRSSKWYLLYWFSGTRFSVPSVIYDLD